MYGTISGLVRAAPFVQDVCYGKTVQKDIAHGAGRCMRLWCFPRVDLSVYQASDQKHSTIIMPSYPSVRFFPVLIMIFLLAAGNDLWSIAEAIHSYY
jgi:hypothetical protein